MPELEPLREKLKNALAILEATDKLEGTYEKMGTAALTTGAERWATRLIWSRKKQERRGADRIRAAVAEAADDIKNVLYGVSKVMVIKYVALLESGKIQTMEQLRDALRAEIELIRRAAAYIVQYAEKVFREKELRRRTPEVVSIAPAL